MVIFIDTKSGCPIYDQICGQVKGQILSGTLAADEPLPSIRSLAKELRISVITTKRAYEELEREGYIYTLPGKGSFVARRNVQREREHILGQMESHMEAIRQLAVSGGVSREDANDLWNLIWEDSI